MININIKQIYTNQYKTLLKKYCNVNVSKLTSFEDVKKACIKKFNSTELTNKQKNKIAYNLLKSIIIWVVYYFRQFMRSHMIIPALIWGILSIILYPYIVPKPSIINEIGKTLVSIAIAVFVIDTWFVSNNEYVNKKYMEADAACDFFNTYLTIINKKLKEQNE